MILHLNNKTLGLTKKNCKRSESSRGKKSFIGKIVKNDGYLKYFHFHPTV